MIDAPFVDTELVDLYQRTSKHSNYQVLPTALKPLLSSEAISVQSRCEVERLAYILAKLPVGGIRAADIGGNTGYFAFELLTHGAAQVDYFEGNAAHHDFVRAAAQRLGLSHRLHTHAGYVTFDAAELPLVDCMVLLNVLHHFGDDFGDTATAKDAAKAHMLDCLATLARTSRTMVFQLGFNWKGDRHLPLFDHGTKAELIDFVRQGTAADWTVDAIGIAERDGSGTPHGIVYRDLSDRNIARDDSLGEFRNRPLFILRSRHAVPVAAASKGATP